MSVSVVDGHAEIPADLEKVPISAFRNNNALRLVAIPASVKVIGAHAFTRAGALTDVAMPSGLEEIEREAFSHCIALTTVALPDSAKTIGQGAFSHCGRLSSLTLPATLHKIDGWAFWGCNALKEVSVGASTELGQFPFPLHTKVTVVAVPGVWESAPESAPSESPARAAWREAVGAPTPPTMKTGVAAPTAPTASISQFRVVDDGHTDYCITVVTASGSHEVERRYSAFRELHDKLQPLMPSRLPPTFPVWKTYISRDRRMRQLDEYVRLVIDSAEGEMPPVLVAFLGLPLLAGAAYGARSAGPSATAPPDLI